MTTCQTAANEFLRQYWSSSLPPAGDLPSIAVASPAQRATKAVKMVGYLAKTQEKVNAIVQVAQQHGIDGTRIENVSWFSFLLVLNCVLADLGWNGIGDETSLGCGQSCAYVS